MSDAQGFALAYSVCMFVLKQQRTDSRSGEEDSGCKLLCKSLSMRARNLPSLRAGEVCELVKRGWYCAQGRKHGHAAKLRLVDRSAFPGQVAVGAQCILARMGMRSHTLATLVPVRLCACTCACACAHACFSSSSLQAHHDHMSRELSKPTFRTWLGWVGGHPPCAGLGWATPPRMERRTL